MFRTNCFAIALYLGLCGAGAPSAFGLSIVFDPTSQNTNLGDQASVDVVLSQPGGMFVGAYDITVGYDATLLDLAGVDFGTGLGGLLDSFQDSISSAASVAVAETSFLFDLSGAQSGIDDFVLFTLVFDTLSLGTSALTLSNVIVGDNFGAALSFQTNNGALTVLEPVVPTPVPAPDMLFLLLAGCAALLRTRPKNLPDLQHSSAFSRRRVGVGR